MHDKCIYSLVHQLRKYCTIKCMFLSLFAATEIMIQDFQVKSNCDSIVLLWKANIVPFQYTLNVVCRHKNFERPYYVKNGIKIRPMLTGYTITNLRPLSKCHLQFWAVYNGASADKGLSITSNTLPGKAFCYTL